MRHKPKYRAMRGLGIVLMCCLMCLLSSTAMAQSMSQRISNVCMFPIRVLTPGAKSCVVSGNCPYGYLCRSGQCLKQPSYDPNANNSSNEDGEETNFPDPNKSGRSVSAPPTPTGEDECSADRRCRINRMRRNNTARRYVEMTKQEAWVMQNQRRYRQAIVSDIHRLVSPINLELYAQMNNPLLGFGVMAGYTFNAKFRLDLGFDIADDYIYVDEFENNIFLDGNIELYSFKALFTYLMRTSWWSPYVTGGIVYGTGTFGNFSASSLDVEVHALHGSIGLDFQSKLGARGRLGFVYRYPVYVRAAFGPGQYDEGAREGLKAWYSQDMSILPELTIGWAF